MTARPSRRALGIGAISASALVLAGCGGKDGPPAVNPGPKPVPTPVVDEQQYTKVVAQTVQALNAADEKRDAALLAPRIVGSAAEFRTATYGIISKFDKWAKELQRFSTTSALRVPTSDGTFPRTVFAFLNAQDPKLPVYIVIFQQKDARSPYTTWGWAPQGAKVPKVGIPNPAVGAAEVPIDAKDLVLSPQDALSTYAEVLGSGLTDQTRAVMIEDTYISRQWRDIWEDRKTISTEEGDGADEVATVIEKYTVHPGEYAGIRTENGGALIAGALRSTRTFTVNRGAKIFYRNPNPITVLAGKQEFRTKLEINSGEIVVLYVPPKEGGAKMQGIGGSKVLLSASGT
ncbi:hypothetical protein [Devriesea agamarum]|uniref:hypothetical protein n=1 Tax=Devriesea agamarum TaxID=472569 RepID=UPI00071CED1A|nr:hypothetical protein [Devriesea agamarum]